MIDVKKKMRKEKNTNSKREKKKHSKIKSMKLLFPKTRHAMCRLIDKIGF